MKKEWFFDRYCGQQFVALLEDGRLTEFAAEKEEGDEIVGNVYKGRVTNVLSGMQAAFVNCGLSRNCYLSTDEGYTDYSKYDGTMSQTLQPELKAGDEVIVQVVKPPRGNKGAKVTTHLSFVGKTLIYLPNTAFLGISRKITDEALREKLLEAANKMRDGGDGFIVRTQAPTVKKRELKKESEYLKKLYGEMREAAKDAHVGSLLYRDLDLPVRIMRDSIGDDVAAMYVGDKELYARLLKLVRLRGDISERKVIYYNSDRAMMHEFGIYALIQEAIQPTVALENGGYLVIEHTEAMTVVDVNTGSFVGNNCLEDTVFCVNMEAAREIARQVRLRNIGGIVAVDFIDMADPAHREAVTKELVERLALDKAKCNVLPMSELCVTEFTRKRVGKDVFSYVLKPCAHCKSSGYVLEDLFLITKLRADILDCFANGYEAAVVDLNEGIMKKILNERLFSKEVAGKWKKKRVYMVPHKTYAEGEYTIRGDNSGVLNLPDKAQILY